MMAEPLEFDCAECGRHIIHFGPAPAAPLRCSTCIEIPDWYRDAELRAVLEPDPDWVPPGG